MPLNATQHAGSHPGGPRHFPRRRRPGVPRALGSAGLRDGAGAARPRPVQLEQGVWAAALASEIEQRPGGPAMPMPARPGTRHWLATLESLVANKGVATPATLHRYRDAWDHAADRTPHGSPIELKPEDFQPSL